MNEPLERLALEAERRPFFLSHLLALYSRAEGLDEAGLADSLGSTPEQLTQLRLCRAPHTDRRFDADVSRLASYFGLDWQKLANVVRYGQALIQMRDACPTRPGMLLAARDAEVVESEPEA